MKRALLFLVVLFMSFVAKTQNYFDRTYDFGDVDHPVAIVTDSLENIYVCGWFEDSQNQIPHAFVLKTGADGEELWRVKMDNTSIFYALCLTHTGNLILAGSKENHCYLTSLNSNNGNELWVNEDTDSDNCWLATVDEILDSTEYKLYVRRETTGPHKLRSLLFNPSNGSLLFDYIGQNTIYCPAHTSGLMAKNKIWTASSGGEYNSGLIVGKNFKPDMGGFYWSFGATFIAGIEKYSPDKAAVVIFDETDEENYSIQILTSRLDINEVWGYWFDILHDNVTMGGSSIYENGKFVLTGSVDNELALWFIDHDFTELTDKIISTEFPRTGVDVVTLASTDMVVMGTENIDNEKGSTDLFLMKRNSEGAASTPEHKVAKKFTVYPNPVTDELHFKSNDNNITDAKAYIINSTGQTVKTVNNLNSPVSVSALPGGLYFIAVYNQGKVLYREKFVKK